MHDVIFISYWMNIANMIIILTKFDKMSLPRIPPNLTQNAHLNTSETLSINSATTDNADKLRMIRGLAATRDYFLLKTYLSTI